MVSLPVTACFRETDVRGAATPGTVTIRIEPVAQRLVVPWGVAFAPDGRIFITERPGRIRVVEEGRLRPEPWHSLEGSVGATGEAGLMGIALAPDFEPESGRSRPSSSRTCPPIWCMPAAHSRLGRMGCCT
jgi:glucose/arabinose dehydrogenase